MAQTCASCSADSPDGAKFCLECGTPFARRCPSCGHPAGAGKFCGECGSSLSAAAAPAPAPVSAGPVSERRTTSVLFGDLVSFTTISEARDPEEVRELLSAYFAVARTVVGRYGGTIEKFIGDAVMAVWGVPVAHEDDAERAVRAGLDLVAEVTALGSSVGVPDLAMRVGIVTGSVAVTLGATNEGMVAGDAVNTAARVQTAAAPTTVWTDDTTRSLTAAAIAYSDMGEHAMKGKAEPARLFRADAVVAARGGAQRVDGLEAPLTGREAELRRLKELFHATEGDGRSRLLLVEGLAGTGKSRLGWEFEKYADGLTTVVRWHRGRCLSYGEGVAFWAFAEMVRSRLGLLEGDDRAQVQAKVEQGVQAAAQDPTEAAWLTPRVAALLTGATGFDRTDLFSAWSVFLERVADGHPLVLLFEDMQHADAGLLDLVTYLVETSRARLLVVVLARPELRQTRPALVAGPRTTVVELGPLEEPDMVRLVDALVGDLPRRAREAIVARAEGVPLYAVETVRSLIDRDAVVPREGRYVFVDHDHVLVDLAQLSAPTSLQTLIAARLDALAPVERRTVQDASVLGLSFRQAGLQALSETSSYDLDVALLGLVRKGVIESVPDPRSPELGSYRFLQALVREVAYSTLARKDRRVRHLAAAAHLESEGEAAEAYAGIIAQHLLDALEATSTTDPDRPAVATRARALLTTSAVRAEALGSPGEALRATTAALALDPDQHEQADLELQAARTAHLSGSAALAVELALRARDHLLQLGRPADAALAAAALAGALNDLGRQREVVPLLLPVLEQLTVESGAELAQVAVLRPLVIAARSTGDRDQQREAALRMLRLGDQLGDPAVVVKGFNDLGNLLIDIGSPSGCNALLESAVALCRQHHLTGQLGRTLSNLLAGTYQDDLGRSLGVVDETLDANRRVGEQGLVALAIVNTGYVRWLAGQWTVLVDDARALLDSISGEVMFVGGVDYLTGLALTSQGRPFVPLELGATEDEIEQHHRDMAHALVEDDPVAAAVLAARSLRRAYGDGEVMDDVEVLLPPVVELQLRAGDVEEAASLLQLVAHLQGGRASTLLRAQLPRLRGLIAAARGEDPEVELRAAEAALADYGAVFYLARTRFELGRWLVAQGRRSEASPLLDLARATFEQLGAAPSLAELEAVQQPAMVSA